MASLALRKPELLSKIDRRLLRMQGKVDVWITLEDEPVAALKADRLAAQGITMQPRAQAQAAGNAAVDRETQASAALSSELLGHRQTLIAKQDSLAGQMQSVGAAELGRVQLASNAIAVRVDARSIAAIAQMAGVAKIRPVVNYQFEPSTQGGKGGSQPTPNPSSYTGRGVRIAILDSGIDYTHYNLGGPGTTGAYNNATANPASRDGLFPTAKVVGGYDFVGGLWPDGELAPDPDPIDVQGHGTHVADIAAGRSANGLHKGIAPDASLLAVKVCSDVATSCNGVAILQGLDYALDPNRDGDIKDAVDVVNMSLGSSYGQQEDDSTTAVARLERLGVVVSISAGNDGNKPYVVGAASTAPGAISVAQTSEPDAKAYPLVLTTPARLAGTYYNTETLDWAPIDRAVATTVVYVGGEGCPGGAAYPISVAGKIALIDRGSCSVSAKVDRAARAGAAGVLIGLVTPGDPVPFSQGEGSLFVPSLVIQQSLSLSIKGALAGSETVTASISPSNAISVAGSMVSSSARGPSYSQQTIKPEIGAPGATVSALVGTGNGTESFGGTSGAAPVISGSAALLVQAFPTLTPEQIKALLMNSAETNIYNSQAKFPGVLAPITRIGAGEVRASRALALRSLARVPASRSAALSFGLVEASSARRLEQTLLVENLGNASKTYSIASSFRYANDEASGAVKLTLPSQVTVPARSRREVKVAMRIDATKLPSWTLDGGGKGGQGELLETVEFDGYVKLTSGSEVLSVPWHVLPRKSADFSTSTRTVRAGQSVTLKNGGAGTGGYEVFALTGTSGNDGEEALPGGNQALIDLRAVGVRLVEEGYLQFAINTYGRRSHPVYPAEFDVYIDTDRDGIDDFVLYNAEVGGFAATGQAVVWVLDLNSGDSAAYFYDDADLNSANSIFTVPTAALGITDNTSFRFSVYAYDNYFSGKQTDVIGPMRFNPAAPRYVTSGANYGDLLPGQSLQIGTAARSGGASQSPSQSGVLLMYRRDRDNEADIIRVTP